MNNPFETSLLDHAVIFAVNAHAGTERRGKNLPYIVHPLEAVAIVATMTTDQELIAAAALHDVVEDTDCTIEQIRQEFGDRIAHLVANESDAPIAANTTEAETWMARKQAGLDRLKNASQEVKIVTMGDKLSNIRAMVRDYDDIGEELWNRFHENDPKMHAWRYRAIAKALASLRETAAYKEFNHLVEYLFSRYD